VVVATQGPVLGFVGSNDAYRFFVKSLAALSLNTAYLIPVHLGEGLVTLSEAELAVVEGVVLADFKGGWGAQVGWDRLASFVAGGGWTWIETGGGEYLREAENLPVVFPVRSLKYEPFESVWQPSGILEEEVDWSQMGPFTYRNEAWKISYPPKGQLVAGAQVLLAQNKRPIVVQSGLGEGKVVWSGLNIFYRPDEFRQQTEEVRLIRQILKKITPLEQVGWPVAESKRLSPEEAVVKGEGFRGVVLKDNYMAGWRATINGKNAPILEAGPSMMYIPVSDDFANQLVEVRVFYQGDWWHWLAFGVTILSTFLALLLLVGVKFKFKKKTRQKSSRPRSLLAGLVETED